MDLKPYELQIKKTGFVLENLVAEVLKRHGWTVISNKYYVDDHEDTVREIDLIAYQVQKIKHLDLYTVLVISCKKSEANVWGLLAREANLKDPNTDWWPLHAWSNDLAVNYLLEQPGAASNFHGTMSRAGAAEIFGEPRVEVFAFQEMKKGDGAPQNDKPIHQAITSLMKAQAYEIGSLPLRKKAPSIYQFNLLSVVDTDLIKLMFSNSDIVGTQVASEQYLARYIIKKKETFSRIQFVYAGHFEKLLEQYDRLRTASGNWFANRIELFYEGIVRDPKRARVLSEKFKQRLAWILNMYSRHTLGKDPKIDSFEFTWISGSEKLRIGIVADQDVIDQLNKNDQAVAQTKLVLASVYKYQGIFEFVLYDDIPF